MGLRGVLRNCFLNYSVAAKRLHLHLGSYCGLSLRRVVTPLAAMTGTLNVAFRLNGLKMHVNSGYLSVCHLDRSMLPWHKWKGDGEGENYLSIRCLSSCLRTMQRQCYC